MYRVGYSDDYIQLCPVFHMSYTDYEVRRSDSGCSLTVCAATILTGVVSTYNYYCEFNLIPWRYIFLFGGDAESIEGLFFVFSDV